MVTAAKVIDAELVLIKIIYLSSTMYVISITYEK